MRINLTPPDFSDPTFLYIPNENSYDGFLYGPNIANKSTAMCDLFAAFGEAAEKYELGSRRQT